MLGVDVGGTFTDVVAVKDGAIKTTKVPTQRSTPSRAVLEGAEQVGVEGAPSSTTPAPSASTRSSRGGCRRSPS